MSYDISLIVDGRLASVRPFVGGGIIEVNPTTMEERPQVEADLNITYNYGLLFRLAAKAALYDHDVSGCLDRAHVRETLNAIRAYGLHGLSGVKAMQAVEALELMIANLDPQTYEDYWAPTPGNAAVPLRTLASWCGDAPDGVFEVV